MARQQRKHSHEAWQKSRLAYEKDGLSFRDIEALHGIANSTLSNRAKIQRWQKGFLKEKAEEVAAMMRIDELLNSADGQGNAEEHASPTPIRKIEVGQVGQEERIEQVFASMANELKTTLPITNKNQRARIVLLKNLYSYLGQQIHPLMLSKKLSVDDGLRYLALLSAFAEKIQKIENEAHLMPKSGGLKTIQLEFGMSVETNSAEDGREKNLIILPSNQREANNE